jgi:sterol desaturase/sphingolipid hydroxylase (fatty acid hydroxylase superfamily)
LLESIAALKLRSAAPEMLPVRRLLEATRFEEIATAVHAIAQQRSAILQQNLAEDERLREVNEAKRAQHFERLVAGLALLLGVPSLAIGLGQLAGAGPLPWKNWSIASMVGLVGLAVGLLFLKMVDLWAKWRHENRSE